MDLVDDRLVQRNVRALVSAPGKRGVDHHGLRNLQGIVPVISLEILTRIPQWVGEHLGSGCELPRDRFGVRIKEHL